MSFHALPILNLPFLPLFFASFFNAFLPREFDSQLTRANSGFHVRPTFDARALIKFRLRFLRACSIRNNNIHE